MAKTIFNYSPAEKYFFCCSLGGKGGWSLAKLDSFGLSRKADLALVEEKSLDPSFASTIIILMVAKDYPLRQAWIKWFGWWIAEKGLLNLTGMFNSALSIYSVDDLHLSG